MYSLTSTKIPSMKKIQWSRNELKISGGPQKKFNALQNEHEKALRETQTLRAGCSKGEPKIFAPPQTSFPGRGTANI